MKISWSTVIHCVCAELLSIIYVIIIILHNVMYIIQYSEANDYSEQKRKAVESLHNKVSHNY